MSFLIYALSHKNGYFREVFICKSYFIYTLFRGKSYFIWKFSGGNTERVVQYAMSRFIVEMTNQVERT